MKTEKFISDLKQDPRANSFSRTMEVIDVNYDFTPTAFINGLQVNKAGENNGSCKIFAFADLHDLSEEETLACFGDFYFRDVSGNPKGEGHQNIRNFMKTGRKGIKFEGVALQPK